MTYKEALEKVTECGLNIEEPLHSEAMRFVKVALEKQIPKKPIDNRYPWAICPNCGGSVNLKNIQEHIHNKEASHCEHCGQALDWGGTE